MTISINLDRVDTRAEVVTIGSDNPVDFLAGQRFISLRDGAVTLILDGFNEAAAAHARAIANALNDAADAIESTPLAAIAANGINA